MWSKIGLAALFGCLALTAAACDDDDEETPPGTGGSGGTAGAGGEGGSTGGAGGEGGSGGATTPPDLDPSLTWWGDNRQRLDEMVDELGVNSPSYDAANMPVVIFDWDNTVIKNDIGDLTTFWMLNNDKILQPPGQDWSQTSPFLTAAAAAALSAACGNSVAAGDPLPTATDSTCTDEILSVYYDGVTTAAEAAFEGWNYRTMEPAYAWTAQLQAGYTPAEISGFATSAFTAGLAAEVGATQTVGTQTMNAYVRIYEQIADLIDVLQQNGFDVWVVSASSQPVVEAFAAQVNVAPERVIGIRTVIDGEGLLSYDLQGCGPVPDGPGAGANTLITYIEGKRCWINKIIYGDTSAGAIDQNPDTAKRPVFGAGDSDTDISFLHDATALKLALNRNKKEIMCNAYGNYEDMWLINPMFIDPKGQYTAGYACSTTACKDETGASVPCVDEGGNVIADQTDTVFE